MKRDLIRQNLGIYVVAVWSVVLGLQNIIRLVYTLSLNSGELKLDAPLWYLYFYQWVSVIFAVAFIIAAIGLWRRRNWGRILFLVASATFFVIAIGGLFSSYAAQLESQATAVLIIRYGLSLALPFIYLNLPFVKEKFTSEIKAKYEQHEYLK